MHRLALALGIARVDALADELSASELMEWIEFYRIEPFGEERADFRAGIIAATIANVHRGKDVKPFAPTDFMPFLERDKKCPSK